MIREKFVYQYLIEYNKFEVHFNNNDAVSYWKNRDLSEGTCGLLFMVIRNALVHNTSETVDEIEKVLSFKDILEALKSCKLTINERIKFLNILFKNKKITTDLENKKYIPINTNRPDVFKLFQRKDEEFYSTIFFSHTNLLFSTTISTYNHILGKKEYFNGYYVEVELFEDQYLIKFFKKDETIISHNINLYIYRNFNPKRLYQSITSLEIIIIRSSSEPLEEIRLNNDEIDVLDNNEIKDLLNLHGCDSTIREAAKKIKENYKQVNNFLHIIGIQNDV